MFRFFVPAHQIDEKKAYVTGDDVNHIRNVLRMEQGEEVVLLDGRGKEYLCRIEEMQKEEILFTVEKVQKVSSELPAKITLFQALPKKDKMELIIQKAVELGAYEVVPVKTRRCIVKLEDEKKTAKKLARWQTIAETAAKQSSRGLIPEVREVMDFQEALAYAKEMDAVLIPYELCESMEGTLEAVKKAAGATHVGIFIGPEGGFERGEVEQAVDAGAVPISLGKRILRTETAGLTILSILMFQMEAEGEVNESGSIS